MCQTQPNSTPFNVCEICIDSFVRNSSLSFRQAVINGLSVQQQTPCCCRNTFNLLQEDFLAYNPGLDCSSLTPLNSVCIGGAAASCNKLLDSTGKCPDLLSTLSLVRCRGIAHSLIPQWSSWHTNSHFVPLSLVPCYRYKVL